MLFNVEIQAMIASKAMAMTAIDVLCNKDLIDKMQNDFTTSHTTCNK